MSSLFRCGYGYGYGLKWDHGLTMAISSRCSLLLRIPFGARCWAGIDACLFMLVFPSYYVYN
jgi:hypothetical protein